MFVCTSSLSTLYQLSNVHPMKPDEDDTRKVKTKKKAPFQIINGGFGVRLPERVRSLLPDESAYGLVFSYRVLPSDPSLRITAVNKY